MFFWIYLLIFRSAILVDGQWIKIGHRPSKAKTTEGLFDVRSLDEPTTEETTLTSATIDSNEAEITKAEETTTTTFSTEITKAQPTTTIQLTTVTFLPSTTISFAQEAKIEFRTCCDEVCQVHRSPWEMVGLICCGHTVIHPADSICCSGRHFSRQVGWRHYDGCCGVVPYGRDQTCCLDKSNAACAVEVYDGADQACCGDVAYNGGNGGGHRPWRLCCGGVLHDLPVDDDEAARGATCCGRQIYDGRIHSTFCCGGAVYSRNDNFECCLGLGRAGSTATLWQSASEATGFQVDTQLCCGGVYNLTPGQVNACCYVWGPSRKSSPTPTPYDASSQCCSCVSGLTQRSQGRC